MAVGQVGQHENVVSRSASNGVLSQAADQDVITDTAILWDAGGVIYVNRPENGADSLDRSDTMVTRTPTGRLCSIDTVTMVDAPSRMMTGIVFLGEFVPYTRSG